MSDDRLRAHLTIVGRVQGVAYRYSACDAARRLGLQGWVRNLPNGAVESIVEGSLDAVNAYVAWCRKGPSMARVTDVAVTHAPATGEFAGFDIRF